MPGAQYADDEGMDAVGPSGGVDEREWCENVDGGGLLLLSLPVLPSAATGNAKAKRLGSTASKSLEQ